MRRPLLVASAALAMVCAPSLSAQTAEAIGTLSFEVLPGEVTPGDRLEATLVFVPASALDAPPNFPVWEEHWGDAEILEAGPVEQGEDGGYRQRLSMVLFEPGLATLPAPTVEIAQDGALVSVAARPAIIDVRSVLPLEEENPQPQPPAPPRALPVGERFWWTAGLLAAACLLLGTLAWRAAKRIGDTLAALRRTPIEAFEFALERLRGESDAARAATGLSLEFRRYLGRSLGFPAAEGTTSEIRRELRSRGLPDAVVRPSLDLLQEADRVKFARAAITSQHARTRLDEAGRLARDIEAWQQPVEVAAGEDAEAA